MHSTNFFLKKVDTYIKGEGPGKNVEKTIGGRVGKPGNNH